MDTDFAGTLVITFDVGAEVYEYLHSSIARAHYSCSKPSAPTIIPVAASCRAISRSSRPRTPTSRAPWSSRFMSAVCRVCTPKYRELDLSSSYGAHYLEKNHLVMQQVGTGRRLLSLQ